MFGSQDRGVSGNSSKRHHYSLQQPKLPPHSQRYSQDNGNNNTAIEAPRASESVPAEFSHFIPSSTSRSSSLAAQQVKFTNAQVCSPSTCICFFIALLFALMALLSGVYYGLNFFDGKHLKERVFKAQFVAHNQEFLASSLEYSDSRQFQLLSDSLRRKIDQLFRESSTLGKAFIKSEIIAFERKRNSLSDVIIHFNVHLSAANKQPIESSDVYVVLAEEILNGKLKVFDNLSIDHSSIDVQERKWNTREKSAPLINPWTYKSIFPGMLEGLSTEPTPAPRKCAKIGLTYCHFLSYNHTSYPNALNHWNVSSLEDEFIVFKEIIDSECYFMAKEFLCALLQPECIDDELILPCKDFCNEFYDSCHRWMSTKVSNRIVCSTFPEQQVRGKRKLYSCRAKPNCAASLRLQGQEYKVCDGIADCEDRSDESSCSYCNYSTQFHCGNRQCVAIESTCDGVKDCTNGADELNCLQLVSLDRNQQNRNRNQGFVRATLKGKQSFVCADSTSPFATNFGQLRNKSQQILGSNICNENYYEQLIRIESKSLDTSGPYSKFVPGTTLISPYSIQCTDRNVYYVECSVAKCGLNPIYSKESFVDGLQALPGYWPWYAKVNLNGNFYCDGTLLSTDTVLLQPGCTVTSGNLSVTLGSVRPQRDNAEAVVYRVLQTIIQTPDSSDPALTLVKVNRPIDVSHYVRPICWANPMMMSGVGNPINNGMDCVVLTTTTTNPEHDQLQSKLAKIVNIDKCIHSVYEYRVGVTGGAGNDSLPANTLTMENYGNKLCVDLNDHPELSTNCTNCATTGRHLYCRRPGGTWQLLAIEHRRLHPHQQQQQQWKSTTTTDVPKQSSNLILFRILPKLSL